MRDRREIAGIKIKQSRTHNRSNSDMVIITTKRVEPSTQRIKFIAASLFLSFKMIRDI